MTEPYVELHAASAFSFLEAGSLPEALAERAAALEMPAMALLDRNGLYGSARFHTMAQKLKIKPHVGAEIAAEGWVSAWPLRNGQDINAQQSRCAFRCFVPRERDIRTFASSSRALSCERR